MTEREDGMMKKVLSVIVVLLLSLSVFAGCGDKGNEEEMKTKEKPLVVAMELTNPPFETKDDKNNPIGVSVDFAEAFGDYIGRDVNIQEISSAELLSSLQSGESDMVLSSVLITEEGKQAVDFSEPYACARLAVLVNKDSGITAVEELNQKQKKIAVIADSAGSLYVQENLANGDIVVLPDENACVAEVATGRADGFVSDQLAIYKGWKNNAETTLPMGVTNQQTGMWGAAVQKGNTELLAQINEFIETYRVNGGFNKLTSKYLTEEKEEFDKLGFKWFFDLD